MEILRQYLLPYALSNLVFVVAILAAWKKPIWARLFLAISFFAAGCVNSVTALMTPKVYLEYGKVALLPVYRTFIYGFFSDRIPEFVLVIALSQFLIAMGLILSKFWTKAACIGGAFFGLGIASLGIGAAFPATISMSIAFFVLFLRHKHDFIWNWSQYDRKGSLRSTKKLVVG